MSWVIFTCFVYSYFVISSFHTSRNKANTNLWKQFNVSQSTKFIAPDILFDVYIITDARLQFKNHIASV